MFGLEVGPRWFYLYRAELHGYRGLRDRSTSITLVIQGGRPDYLVYFGQQLRAMGVTMLCRFSSLLMTDCLFLSLVLVFLARLNRVGLMSRSYTRYDVTTHFG